MLASGSQRDTNYPSYSFRTKFYQGGVKLALPSPSSLEGAEQAQEQGQGWSLRSLSPSPCRYPRASAWPPVSGLGTRWARETSCRPGGAPWSPCWSQVLSSPAHGSPSRLRGTAAPGHGPPFSRGCFSLVFPPELFAVAFCVLLLSCKDLVGYIFTTDR